MSSSPTPCHGRVVALRGPVIDVTFKIGPLPPIEQALAIDQAKLGQTHPLIADDFCDLGLVYAGLDRKDDAAQMLAYAIGLLDLGSGSDSSRMAYAELDLAGVLHMMGYNDAADAAFADGKRILDKAGDEDRDREREL